MKFLSKFAISRPVTTSMFFLALILLGAISISKLEINLLPKLEFPRITVITMYAYSAPQEVEKLISKPISEAVGTINGVTKITSESVEGISFVTLQFQWGTNIDFAAMEVREKVDLIRGILPENASKSVVTKFDPSQSALVELVIFPKKLSNKKNLRYFLRTEVKNFLDRIPGVASVQFSGGYQKEVQVKLDPVSLNSFDLTIDDVQNAISTSNMNYPAGTIKQGKFDYLVRTIGEYKRVADIEKTIVGRNSEGVPIHLKSLGKVIDGYKERTGLARYKGVECVIVSFYKEAGKNTVQVSKNIEKTVNDLKQKFKKEIDLDIVYNQADFVQNSIDNIFQALIVGGFLGFFTLLLILRNFKSPLILLTSVPTSVMTTFLLMHMQNISINVMSLGGLSLGIGMLFDSGNVVLSAIELHIQKGIEPKQAALQGASDVVGSITAAILTTIIVFLPIVFLKGVVGVVFADMALTICFSLGVSLFVSISLIPMLSSLRSSKSNLQTKEIKIFSIMASVEEKLEAKYENSIMRILQNPRFFIFVILSLFLLSIFLVSRLEKEFIPKVDTGEFEIILINPKGTSLEQTSLVVHQIEDILKSNQSVEHVISYIGYDEDQILSRKSGSVGTHQARVKVVLKKNRNIKTNEFVKQLRPKLDFDENIKLYLKLSGDILTSLLSPESRPITLEVAGDDLDILSYVGKQIRKDLAKINGIVDIAVSMEEKDREYHVIFNDEKLAIFNLTNEYVSKLLKTAIKGEIATNLRIADEEIKVRIQYNDMYRKNLKKISKYRIKIGESQYVTMDQVVDIKPELGYTSVIRSDQNRINRITANVQGVSLNKVFDTLENYLLSLKLPDGYSIDFGGEKRSMDRSFIELLFALGLAVILIYMVLSSQFESLIFPIIMMASIPLIIIGSGPALTLANKSLNIGSFTGLILLVGMVVDNSALFYEYFRLNLLQGKSLEKAIVDAGKIVLKPVLMNNGTTMLGLLPIALELGEGTEFQSPMAITVIGGMFASVGLSLFFIPLAFYLLKKFQTKKA